MTLDTMLAELRFGREIETAVLQKIRKNEKEIEAISKTAYQGEDYNFSLCRRMPLTRLAVVTYLLPGKYDDYRAQGTPEELILDTFRDVSLRANLYYEKTGRVGISKGDVIWFRHIMNGVIFKIGSLQFQPFEMIYLDQETVGEPYMTFTAEQKEALPAGASVINCHIQQGADLRPEAIDGTLQRARRFFSEHFPAKFKAFLCYSWLLYPPMVRSLPSASNIKQFADRFTVIGTVNDPEQAREYLFGQGRRGGFPSNATTLQKLASEHIDLFGFACGIINIS